jgi:hypothetical protein
MRMNFSRRAARAAWSCSTAAALAVTLGGCAAGGAQGAGRASERAKRQADLITSDELAKGQWASAYDAVRTLRPQWLNSKGPDTILGEQGEIQIRLDDSPLGGIASLRQVNALGIAAIRWIDPVSAAGRWGGAYAHGAIVIMGLKR